MRLRMEDLSRHEDEVAFSSLEMSGCKGRVKSDVGGEQ